MSYCNGKAFRRFLFKSFFKNKGTHYRLTLKRLGILLLSLVIYLPAELLIWSGLTLDEIFYPAYREIKTKPTRSNDEIDMLISLVSFLAMGEVKDYLLDAIEETRQSPGAESSLLPRVKVPSAIKSWMRVPSSTWLISGITILVSVFGYLFMKGR